MGRALATEKAWDTTPVPKRAAKTMIRTYPVARERKVAAEIESMDRRSPDTPKIVLKGVSKVSTAGVSVTVSSDDVTHRIKF